MHAHSHDDHDHHHHHPVDSGKVLLAALGLTLGFAFLEAVAGWWSGSLALLGDAGHMVTDSAALGFAALAAWLAKRPPTPRHSYGLLRAEVVTALINGLFMMVVVAGIVVAAIDRLSHPAPVAGGAVMAVAAAGMAVNIGVAYVLMRGERNLNIRGALLHVMGDLLGSIAALASGAVIYFTGWLSIDPILSLLISVLILYSGIRLLLDVLHVIMEGVPLHLNLDDVGKAMAETEGVASIHDLHIWTLSSGMIALSAHVVVRDLGRWQAVLPKLANMLETRFHIDHVTLQPEPEAKILWPMDRAEAPQDRH